MQKLEAQKLGQALGQNVLGMQGGQWVEAQGGANAGYTASGSGLLARTVASMSNRYSAADVG